MWWNENVSEFHVGQSKIFIQILAISRQSYILLYTMSENSQKSNIFFTESQGDYELLDSGLNYKLERFGRFVLSRPDPQALWPRETNSPKWQSADAEFKKENGTEERGSWHIKNKELKDLEKWSMDFGGLTLQIKLSPFKHTGLFPEQLNNWRWMEKIIADEVASGNRAAPIKVLNLFGYTGGASLISAKAGAEVTHVDASKSAITWANENAELSGLAEKPIRWILDDALAFVKKEIRRGNKYDAIVMDPPAFGRGVKGEVWKIEEKLLPLIADCMELLSQSPLFFILNGYASGYSAITYAENLRPLTHKFGGELEFGELTIAESKSVEKTLSKNQEKQENPEKQGRQTPRLLPCGIVARWKR